MVEAGFTPLAELGQLALVSALALTGYAVVASAFGAARNQARLIESGRRAMLAAAAVASLAMGCLLVAFVVGDFSIKFVWQTSSSTTPALYLFTGVWGGQAGSLLFWSWLMAVFTAVALLGRWRADQALLPWFTAVAAFVTGFFLLLVVFKANPFERLAVIPPEGNGLNPLLQHPGMAFHPPALYLGFTGMTIPFAFAMAALLSGRTDAGWIQASRRWMLVAWAFLTIGLALGGRWAYDVLGWGGYWGWDPVENAAFMPWIAATAFLHSVMIQERRGAFKIWNMALIILTFSLVIVGTFLTRAGLVSSVHSFAESDIGGWFLIFTTIMILGSLVLLWWRLPILKSDSQIEHPFSREGAFMANNLLFMGALFAVFWGTLFPLFSEILTDQRVSVGAPYFNRVAMPIFGMIVLLMAVGPLVGWRQADPARVGRALLRPALASLLVILALAILGVRRPVALIGFGVSVFAGLVTLVEIARGVRARMRRGEAAHLAFVRLVGRNRRRYGGYCVHVGIALLGVGVVASNLYQLDLDRSLALGESVEVGPYSLRFEGLEASTTPDSEIIAARLAVSRDGRPVTTLLPRKQVFRLREDQPRTIPSVYARPSADLYALLGSFETSPERATLKLYLNPLISLVWWGLIVLVAGTLTAAWPDGAEARVLDAELSRLLGASAGA
jgi:cytochrome c-type biogenesis protein CcmF